MSGKIYVLGEDASLEPMDEAPYEAEALLQALLAQHSDLLAGDQIRPSSPRRWLLISRELGVPGDPAGGSRWSIDHLFIDQEGIPTLVEVKRSTNTQIRREVVGQMLDYAANASAYWALDHITSAYERRCEDDGSDSDEVLSEFLSDEAEADDFWQRVKTNLQAGRIRLLFVADAIPAELRRIIEFLNEQMDPAEVLGVEVRQYLGAGSSVLVPRVVGMTAEAEQRKTATDTQYWDETSFLERLQADHSEVEVDVARQILNWATDRDLVLRWGRGRKGGTFSPKAYARGVKHNMFTVNTYGYVQTQFASMNESSFDRLENRRALADRLANVHQSIDFDDSKLDAWPGFRLSLLSDTEAIGSFFAAWEWYLGELGLSASS